MKRLTIVQRLRAALDWPGLCIKRAKKFGGLFGELLTAQLSAQSWQRHYLQQSPRLRRTWRFTVWLLTALYFVFVLLVLVLRYSILPNIENYRPAIEGLASSGLGQSVSIGRIEASWAGLNPRLALLDVQIADPAGKPALAFSRIETIISWWSLPKAQLKLDLLRIIRPSIHLRRALDGQFFVAGLPLKQNAASSDNAALEWVFKQRQIRIDDATLIWDDALRAAPSLELKALNVALDNVGKWHRFGISAKPPAHLAAQIDLRGNFRSSGLEQIASADGQIYAEMAYADLAAWQAWLDYPIELPSGQGALRSWLTFDAGQLRDITSDVSLVKLNLRLAKDLPALDLAQVSGRLHLRFPGAAISDSKRSDFTIEGKGVSLLQNVLTPNGLTPNAASGTSPTKRANSTLAPIRLADSHFKFEWLPGQFGQEDSGRAEAERLDIGALARLADYFPLPPEAREQLAAYAPRGTLNKLNAAWTQSALKSDTPFKNYTISADFADLAVQAHQAVPGFSGFSGRIEAHQAGGSITLNNQKSSLDLPAIFEVSRTEFDTVNAEASWTIKQKQLAFDLKSLSFASPEFAASAHGSYRSPESTENGPGIIDLSADLIRADARVVWRYLPLAVGQGARHWVRDSLKSGHSSGAKLRLKGNLKDFPFLDKSTGEFIVNVKANDVVLDYANGWPRIDNIQGDLVFAGPGMQVKAHSANILGAKLVNTEADIADFDWPVPVLNLTGRAEGATAEFLKFIEKSPVADKIDHFSDDMRASGNGYLDLKLNIPLDEKQVADAKINGNYVFTNNEVTVDANLPPLKQVNGNVQFSEKTLTVPEITAKLFGGPLKIKGGLQSDGKVLITANGSVNTAELRKQLPTQIPAQLASHFSGSANYQGEITVNQRNTDLLIESSLQGIASSLPVPFAKAAQESLALRFEKKTFSGALPADKSAQAGATKVGAAKISTKAPARDLLNLSLGNVLALQIVRRQEGKEFVPERGAIAIGRKLVLPERGVTLGISAKSLDADAWRSLLSANDQAGAPSVGSVGQAVAADETPFLLDLIDLKTPSLLLLGRQFDDVAVSVTHPAGKWKAQLDSKQANGDLEWDGRGKGRLIARFKTLKLDTSTEISESSESSETSDSEVTTSDAVDSLPAVDFVADSFSLGARNFGRLELQAQNLAGIWNVDKFSASSAHGTLTGHGTWRLGTRSNRTQLEFNVESKDVGKLLDQFGYPETVYRGSANLSGNLAWQAAPTLFDFASLSGEMNVSAKDGQFIKLNPGKAGKLLGLISLQSLPRRISLDFKDVFSDGFAFDKINSQVSIENGVMRTDRLQIDGPAARVLMRGEVDLKNETQRLNVNVQPELSDTAALGVALINPIAGAATWVAQKVLQNPLNKLFSFNYLVSGTWSDPKVDKLPSNQAPDLNLPRLPQHSSPSGQNP